MQQFNYIKKMLGIQGVTIKKLCEDEHNMYIYLETKPKTHNCPKCGENTRTIHDYREQRVQHFAYNGKTSYLVVNKRRYRCNNCGKKFYENYEFIQNRFRKSIPLYHSIIKDAKDLKNFKTIAKDNNVSAPTVARYVKYEIFLINKNKVTIFPKNIGIDEFKGNVGNNKYQLQIIDLDTRKIVDIVKGKSFDELEEYFSQITNRENVKKVTMDLCLSFKRLVKGKFKNAIIIADKFHYTRLVLNVLDYIRIELQRPMSKEYRKYLKNIKRILMKRGVHLTQNQKDRLSKAFEISSKLRVAYELKEAFLKINDTTGHEEKESMFRKWIMDAENTKIKEFLPVITTLRNWHEYISNSFKYNLSNGPTEGKNNKIKVLKRIAFGFRNFDNFRNRILLTV